MYPKYMDVHVNQHILQFYHPVQSSSVQSTPISYSILFRAAYTYIYMCTECKIVQWESMRYVEIIFDWSVNPIDCQAR